MHFSTIGNKKGFRKKISVIEQDVPQVSNIKDKNATRKRKIKVTLYLSVLIFFVIMLISLKTFGGDNYYSVKRDETVEMIARKFNIPQKILLTINELSDASELKEGMRIQIPYDYDIYIAKAGDTLYDIAMANGVKQFKLASHNKFIDTKVIKSGDIIHIPRILQDIRIKSSKTIGLKPFKIEFSVLTNTRGKVKQYKWDLGDGSYSNKKSPVYTYKEKGTYKVSLEVTDENNNSITSNILTINVKALANMTFTNTEYFEVNANEIINLNAKVMDNSGESVPFDYTLNISGVPVLIEQIGRSDQFRVLKATQSNFASLKLEFENYAHAVNLFVSPIASKNNTRPDIPWYKTQFKSGLDGKSGPACAAMAITWATGKEIDAGSIRNLAIQANGTLGFNHIILALEKNSVKSQFTTIDMTSDLFNIIDRGNIAIVFFDLTQIEPVKGKNLYGSCYTTADNEHFAIIKGYSLNRKYIIVNDPVPADMWVSADRSEPAENIAGRNRYYIADNLQKALRLKTVLEIYR